MLARLLLDIKASTEASIHLVLCLLHRYCYYSITVDLHNYCLHQCLVLLIVCEHGFILLGAGVDHDQLVGLAEKHFNSLPTTTDLPQLTPCRYKCTSFHLTFDMCVCDCIILACTLIKHFTHQVHWLRDESER